MAHGIASDSTDALTLLAAFGHVMIRDFMFTAVIEDDHAAMGDVLMGQLSGAPDWARVDRTQELGHQLLTEAPTGHRAPVPCMVGRLHWYKGSSSFAVKFIELAKADDPKYQLAELLLQGSAGAPSPRCPRTRTPPTERICRTPNSPAAARSRNGSGPSLPFGGALRP